MKILTCWLGGHDIDACEGTKNTGQGPIAQAAMAEPYDRILLLSDWEHKLPGITNRYKSWLSKLTSASIEAKQHRLSNPTDFQEIYQVVESELKAIKVEFGSKLALTLHISPGTSQMAAIWIVMAKTRFPARLIQSSKEGGVVEAIVPFEMSAEFIPAMRKHVGDQLIEMIEGVTKPSPGFTTILHKSPEMKRCIAVANRMAPYPIPVLIEGESGTGKELLAQAIHIASGRTGKIVSVNCGAIPQELVESEFFGHGKGAFSGATQFRKGHFEEANGGTLFLDEVGELPKSVQVKLLRVLQEGKVVRVGTSDEIAVDVRVIAATNRNLAEEVDRGNFREDLFYRLAVGMVRLPPLRDRRGDLGLLIDHQLKQIVENAPKVLQVSHKTISTGARNILLNHSWPGNIRELFNTLQRAVVWSDGETIDKELISAVMFSGREKKSGAGDILNQPIDNGINLVEVIGKVARHYIERALVHTHGNKSAAARLLHFASYQRLGKWAEKYGANE